MDLKQKMFCEFGEKLIFYEHIFEDICFLDTSLYVNMLYA